MLNLLRRETIRLPHMQQAVHAQRPSQQAHEDSQQRQQCDYASGGRQRPPGLPSRPTDKGEHQIGKLK